MIITCLAGTENESQGVLLYALTFVPTWLFSLTSVWLRNVAHNAEKCREKADDVKCALQHMEG